MGWYFFLFVPSQLEYFIGARFRTLAVCAGHLKSKMESLQKSWDNASKNLRQTENLGPYRFEFSLLRSTMPSRDHACEVTAPGSDFLTHSCAT
jgi:hypothetical protein